MALTRLLLVIGALAGCATFALGFATKSGVLLMVGTVLVEVAGPFAIAKLFFRD